MSRSTRTTIPSRAGVGPRLHVLGHPVLPLDSSAHPEDSQLLNCLMFCRLAEAMEIPYAYYGMEGSVLPPGKHGQFVSLGELPEGAAWAFRNSWHREYTRRLQNALEKHVSDDGKPEWLASLYGVAQRDLPAWAVPVLEPMVGYGCCWTHYRVFPSHAQESVIYATQPETLSDRFFDTVIPHFLNAADYGVEKECEGYLCYLGRNAEDKGVQLAKEIASAAGLPLRMVHRGCRGVAKRQLLGRAIAVLMPTLYVEPFGYVAAEAMLCGTPVIATDWGAFPEIIRPGIDGYCCRTLAEFLEAVRRVPSLDRLAIRDGAVKRFSLEAVQMRYRRYLDFVWRCHVGGGFAAEDALR